MPIQTAIDLLADLKRRRPDLIPADLPDPGARLVVDFYLLSGRPNVSVPVEGATVGPAVIARVDRGRWLGDCDLHDLLRKRQCRSAQYLHPTDRRFFCGTCGNAQVGGRWRLVDWPADPATVEQTLAGKPSAEQQWRP